ncbi:MAG: sugar phosphate nucleotidyltransferase [Chlamydiales bacterium]|nr:sugar phosphate nucleotidyltransferase [Chlamydiales bacterium]
MHVVILAGGEGTRLWPMSRQERPKQFLSLCGPHSLLQETVLRFLNKHPVVIVTQACYEELVFKQLEAVSASHLPVVIEPARKNTAAAIALALRFLEESKDLKPDDPVLVVPSDHWISPQEVFLDYMLKVEPAVKLGKIVTFGICPTKPETGFGYIQLDRPFDSCCYHVKQFVEKPTRQRAEQFISDPMYYWNSGMFAFSSSAMWQAFALYFPALSSLQTQSWTECLHSFSSLPSISIDYAVIEKTDQIVSCPLPIRWSDMGSWENLYEFLEKDQQLNVKRGDILAVDTEKCLIFGDKKKIAAIGLEEMIIIDTEDVIFIGKKKDAQKIRDLSSGKAH